MAVQDPVRSVAARRRGKRKSRLIPIAIGVVVIVAAAWVGWAKTHQGNDPTKNLLTAKVTRGDLMETVSATGSISAQTGAQVKIGSQITGRIKRLYADVGSSVNGLRLSK